MSTVTIRKNSDRRVCERRTWEPRFRVTLVSELKSPKSTPRSSWLRPVLAFALVVTVFAAGITVGRSHQAISRTPPDNSTATLEPFWETWNLAEKHFVNGTQRQRLVQGAIRGLLDSLGDQGHTHYETKEEFERYVTVMNGEAHGIGVRLRLAHRRSPSTSPLELSTTLAQQNH